MKLSNNLYFDNENGKFIVEKFLIDGVECSEDEYYEMLEELECVVENEDEDCCDCVDCTINLYTEIIYELANGQICPGCVHDVLESFFDTMVDHIIIESLEED